mmetsp:Transcript_8740/g.16038  ORF Transcript_8740/g.16038 Transcript_8740/m.16038 type:complete len:80 (+) Transcript_8740:2354-2593(+)
MKTLLETVEARQVKNAIIGTDNAKFHKTLPKVTPKGSWNKEELMKACAKCNIDVGQEATKAHIWKLFEALVNTFTPRVI